ncbi:unnamed protein product [Brassica rapa subsp. narinosa]
MVELCGLFRIARSQLTLPSWGLIHALQVLSDLFGVEITGSMIATAFRTRRFELLPRPRCRSPVKRSEWIENTSTVGKYFFVLHLGPRPNGFCLSLSPPGLSPEDPAESAAFPENLMNLTTYLRGPAFFAGSRHHPDDFIGEKKIQETIPHECVLYFVGDFQVNNWYFVKDFRIKTKVGRTRTIDNIFKLKFTISTIVKHIPSVSTSLYFHPASFADIIHWRFDFKIAVGMQEYNQLLWNLDVPEVNVLRERFFALESDDSSG